MIVFRGFLSLLVAKKMPEDALAFVVVVVSALLPSVLICPNYRVGCFLLINIR